VRLIEKGVFDQRDLIEKTYPFSESVGALEEVAGDPGIIKAALINGE
jgi:hypothetical protein